MRVAHPAGLAVLAEVLDLAPHRAAIAVAFVQQFLKLFHYATPLADAKMRPVLPAQRHPLQFAESVFHQGKCDTTGRMAAIENFVSQRTGSIAA